MRCMEPPPRRMAPSVMEPAAAVAMRSRRAVAGSLVGFCAKDGRAERKSVRKMQVRAISIRSKCSLKSDLIQGGRRRVWEVRMFKVAKCDLKDGVQRLLGFSHLSHESRSAGGAPQVLRERQERARAFRKCCARPRHT